MESHHPSLACTVLNVFAAFWPEDFLPKVSGPSKRALSLWSEDTMFSHNSSASIAHGFRDLQWPDPPAPVPPSRVLQRHLLCEPFFTNLSPLSFLAILKDPPVLMTVRGRTWCTPPRAVKHLSCVCSCVCMHAHGVYACMCVFCPRNLGPCSTDASDGGDTP